MNNWTIEETKELFDKTYELAVDGRGLGSAFEYMAQKTGRSRNSIRNYYYSQLNMFNLVPELKESLGIRTVLSKREKFVTFEKDEITRLIESVLVGKANGVSVRKTILQLSGGDSKVTLRLQNKYRSMLVHHKKRVCEIMENLAAQGIAFYDPYTKQNSDKKTDNFARLTEYVSSLDDSDVSKFLSLITKLR